MLKESEYVSLFKVAVEKVLKEVNFSIGKDQNLCIEADKNLFYELTVNQNLDLQVKNIKKQIRGESAFQTDICIFEKKGEEKFPRVVIEFKINPSTHDILVYSAKAGKHKQVYPWLRYGMFVCDLSSVPIKKFSKHNDYMDFCVAAKDFLDEKEIHRLHEFAKKLVLSEIVMSQTIESMYFDNPKMNFYQKAIVFNDFEGNSDIHSQKK